MTCETGSTRVLVVEDTPLNMELVRDLLEGVGHVVARATSAEACLELARTEHPDLILMDLSLPGMDGLAATRALKANPLTRHIPVVALTAHAMRGDQEQALAAGCAGYITKPIDTRAFVSSIEAFVAADREGPRRGNA